MSELLHSRHIAFLERLRSDLAKAEQRYTELSGDMEEYAIVRSFITKELEFKGHEVDRKFMMNFGKQVYTKAKVKANAKILIRVQDDLFIEMAFKRALSFVAKRLDFLNGIAEEYLKEIAQIKAHMTMTHAVMDPTKLQ